MHLHEKFCKLFLSFIYLGEISMCAQASDTSLTQQPHPPLSPPQAERRENQVTYHGITLEDPYAWLRDPKWKTAEDGVQDPQILEYIQAENAYTDNFFAPLHQEIDSIFRTYKGYIPSLYESLKMKRDNFLYFYRQQRNDNYPTFLRQQILSFSSDGAPSLGAEEVYFNMEEEASKEAYYHVGGKSISNNHRWLAYSEDKKGNEYHRLCIKDLETKEFLTEHLDNVTGSVIWAKDDKGFYYLKHDEEWHTLFLYYHERNTSSEDDILLFEETDRTRSLHMGLTFDKKYLIISSSSKEDDEVYFMDMEGDVKTLNLLAKRALHRQLSVSHHQGYFYLMEITQVFPNARLLRVPVGNPLQEPEEVLPHNPQRYFTFFEAYKDHFLLVFREKGLKVMALMDPISFTLKPIPLAVSDPVYDLSIITNEFEDDHFWYEVSSLARPKTTYKVFLKDLRQEVVKVQEIPGFDQSLYSVERLWAVGKDGVHIPISLAYRKDKITPDQGCPTLLYGYGSYGINVSPGFSNRALCYMDHGFAYAIAHVRGGDDLGYEWYLDGKYLKKKNTFEDFIACAQHLVEKGYGKDGKVSAMGGSAGGMLMGYIANTAPSLFRSIAALVPFVDVMNTMTDPSLPLTLGEFNEWGNPIENETYFKYMLSYSPYDNIRDQDYPAMLITGGLTDPRVTYWEPTKWIAKLRYHHKGENPLLLKMIMSAGHGGGSKRDEGIREEAEILAFFLKTHGML